MLTCKVGESNVNTFDFKDEKLREWSNKGMLKCPVCGEKMLYCHGDFKIPYFRHEKNSNCPDTYSEGVTEEHLKGVQIIYEWLLKQEDVLNLQLEKWIPETRQRPDIYFEKEENGIIEKYAIEFQCSPIATKYNERHDLYRLSGINDIWILGTLKYDINNFSVEKLIFKNKKLEEFKTKTIEREIYNTNKPLIYLNTSSKRIYQLNKDGLQPYPSSKFVFRDGKWIRQPCLTKFNVYLISKNMNNCTLNNIFLKNTIENDFDFYEDVFNSENEYIKDLFKNNKEIDDLRFNEEYTNEKSCCMYFSFNNNKYCVLYNIKKEDIKEKYNGFKILKIQSGLLDCNINNFVIDMIEKTFKIKYKDSSSNIYIANLNEVFFDGEYIVCNDIKDYIFKNAVKNMVEEKNRRTKCLLYEQEKTLKDAIYKNEIDKFKYKYKDIISKKIIIIDGYYSVDKNVKYKFVKNFEENKEFILNNLPNIMMYLKDNENINIMLPKEKYIKTPKKRNMYYILSLLKEYGFNNICEYKEGVSI